MYVLIFWLVFWSKFHRWTSHPPFAHYGNILFKVGIVETSKDLVQSWVIFIDYFQAHNLKSPDVYERLTKPIRRGLL